MERESQANYSLPQGCLGKIKTEEKKKIIIIIIMSKSKCTLKTLSFSLNSVV
jgi:hypothetical protein